MRDDFLMSIITTSKFLLAAGMSAEEIMEMIPDDREDSDSGDDS